VIVPVGASGAEELILAVAVIGLPNTCVVDESVSVRPVTPGVMVTLVSADVLAVKFVSPEYWTVTECGPTLSNEVVKLPVPVASKAVIPSEFVPSKNCTVPVGVPPAAGVTLAVRVVVVPNAVLAAEVFNAVVVVARATLKDVLEMDAVKLVSPE
jgi:hypothetical protein